MANGKSPEAELGRLFARCEDCFGVERQKESGKGGAFSFSVANFMANFHEFVSLYCACSLVRVWSW